MNNHKNKILIGAMACLLLSTACNLLAQNEPGRWYLGLDAGLAVQQDVTLEGPVTRKLAFDPGFRLDLSGGVHLSESWRAELEVGFTYNSITDIHQEYFQVPLLANGIYTLPLRGPISVYVGAGLGGVSTMLWDNHLFGDTDGSFTFGYQGIVGAKYVLNDNLDLGLTYKLLGTLDHDFGAYQMEATLSHSFLAAFTFKF